MPQNKGRIKEQNPFPTEFQRLFPENFRSHGPSLCPDPDCGDTSGHYQLNEGFGYCHKCQKSHDIFNLQKIKTKCSFKEAVAIYTGRNGARAAQKAIEKRQAAPPVGEKDTEAQARKTTSSGDAKQSKPEAGKPPLKEKKRKSRPYEQFRTCYTYVDEQGKKLFFVNRFSEPGCEKFFTQRAEGRERGLGDVRLVLYRLPEIVSAEEILFLEGEKCVEAARELGFHATCNPMGARKWPKQCEKHGIHKPLKDKSVYILPDADEPGKAHARDVARSLHKFAKSVKILTLPDLPEEGDDLCDYIRLHGQQDAAETIVELIRDTPEYDPAQDIDAQSDEIVLPVEIREGNGKEERKPAEDKFVPLVHVERIQQKDRMVFIGGQMHVYREGVYTPLHPQEVDRLIVEDLGSEARAYQVKEVRNFLELDGFVDPEKVNPQGFLNTQSGILDLATGEEVAHGRDFISTIQIPLKVDPHAQCPTWQRFLDEVLPETEKQELLQQIFGYCLTPGVEAQKAFLFLGSGANGKSVSLEVLEHLVGPENTSALTLDDLREKFRICELQGRLVNLSYEIETRGFVADGRFKSLVAGEPLLAERKNQQAFKFRPTVKLIFATNRLPNTRDKSQGFIRRVVILPFSETIPEERQDRTLAKRIVQNELSGVLNWALKGELRRKEKGTFTIPEASKEAKEEYRREINPALCFIEECLERAKGGFEMQNAVYDRYRAWANSNGYQQVSSRNLKKTLEAELDIVASHSREGNKLFGVRLSG